MHMVLEEPFAGDDVKLPAIDQFLKLPLGSRVQFEKFSGDPIGKAMFSSDFEIFSLHVAGNSTIRRLAMFV